MNNNDNKITFDLHDPRAQAVALCGGKAANLAKLAAAGFAEPQARIVSVETYRAWFEQLSSSPVGWFGLWPSQHSCRRVRYKRC